MDELNDEEITRLVIQLVGSPRWHGETNADKQSVQQIEQLSNISESLIYVLMDALSSATKAADDGNFSGQEVKKAAADAISKLKGLLVDEDE